MDCPARGQVGQGNIRIHSRQRVRYRCSVCGQTFSDRAGTPFFRRRTAETTITCVLTLVGNGCPIPAIEAAFGFQAQTVREWVEASGKHCERVHHEKIVQPRDLEHVQADEIRLKTQAGVLWMAMALMVTTRLWLGGAVSQSRDRTLIERLVAVVAGCASFGPLLFVSDGLKTYIDVVRRAFRTRQTGTGGRPRLIGWPDLVIAQVVKQYAGRAVTGTIHRLIHGSVRMYLTLLWSTAGCQLLNTALIERLNGTFRSRLAGGGDGPACWHGQWPRSSGACIWLGRSTTSVACIAVSSWRMGSAGHPRWRVASRIMSGRSASCCTFMCRHPAGSRHVALGVDPVRFKP